MDRDRPAPAANRNPLAGGMPLAVGTVVGTVVGLIAGQPSIGFLMGLGLGVVVAVGVWLIDRRR